MSDEHFVHSMTGPGVWTKSILEYFNVAAGKLSQITVDINGLEKAGQSGFYCHNEQQFFYNQAVRHLFGSVVWRDGKYVRWTEQRENLRRRL